MNSLCFLSGLSSSEWAAWVQAGASIATIIVGAIAIYWQTGRSAAQQQARDRAVDVRRLQLMWVLAYECRVELQHMSQEKNAALIDVKRLHSKVRALGAIPVFEIPATGAGTTLYAMLDAYDKLRSIGKEVEGSVHQKLVQGFLPKHINAALESFEFGERRLRLLLADIDASIPDHSYSINGVAYPPLEAG